MLGPLTWVVSFIWLAILGEYDAIVLGFSLVFLSHIPIGFLIMLGVGVFSNAGFPFALFISLLIGVYSSAAIISISNIVSQQALIPAMLLAHLAAATPWVKMADTEQEHNSVKENLITMATWVSFGCFVAALLVVVKGSIPISWAFGCAFVPALVTLSIQWVKGRGEVDTI